LKPNYYTTKNFKRQRFGPKYTIVGTFYGVPNEALVTEGSWLRSGQKLGEFINTNDYELEVSHKQKTYAICFR